MIGCDVEECRDETMSLGADEYIVAGSDDYKKLSGNKLDVIVSVATREEPQLAEFLNIINPGGTFVSSVPIKNKVYAGPDYDGKRGIESLPLAKELEAKTRVNCRWMTVKRGEDRLEKIVKMIEAGKLKPIINKVLTMDQYKQLNYDYEAGKVRGRNLVLIEESR